MSDPVPTRIKIILISLLMGTIAASIFAYLSATRARADNNHDHHRFHAYYQNWINKEGRGCCNDRDCKTISESDVKETARGTFVRIEGELCPVLSKHYLAKGNAPNWDSAHVCVQPKSVDIDVSPCARLLCFQPKPGG